ncbi:MAG TPA: hypothetical protein VL326_11690 [Kofleriaceae bacterium]|nr:hypothetical protein [Kofleriaceae bacterium]
MKLALALLLVAGCRLSVNKWGGAPPRASDHVKIALYDNGGGELAKRVLSADSRVEVIAFDPTVNEKGRTDCGNLACPLAVEPACKWAAQQGADYYAIAAVGSAFKQTSKCTKHHTDWSKVFDKGDDDEVCDESVITSEGTTGGFTLTIYDAVRCEVVPALSEQVQTYAAGSKEESNIEAAAQVAELAPTKFPGFPDQTVIGPDGHVVNAPGDGQYALFRDRQFEGIARIHHTGMPNEHVHMLMCCTEPQPGDVLVRRGPMHFYELDLTFDAGVVERGDAHVGGLGAGLQIRRKPLAQGLEYGLGASTMNDEGSLGTATFRIETGWGYQVSALLHLSAALEVGFAYFAQGVGAERATGFAPYVMPQARAQLAIRWWYLGLDGGYAMSSTIGRGDWSGAGANIAEDARMRGPLGRLYTGITL